MPWLVAAIRSEIVAKLIKWLVLAFAGAMILLSGCMVGLPLTMRTAQPDLVPLDSGFDATIPDQHVAIGMTTSGYVFPVVGWHGVVQLHWGAVRGGSDLFAARGTPAVLMHEARIISAGWDTIGGNAVFAQGTDGLQYYYAHFDASPAVRAGLTVPAGTYLGPVGDTGDAKGTGTHLHIGIGPTILLGSDKFGGTGGNFDAVGLLQRTLDGR